MRVPLLNFEWGPCVLFLNFEGVLRVPRLNLRGVPGPTFKLGVGSLVRGRKIVSPSVLVPLLHHAGFFCRFQPGVAYKSVPHKKKRLRQCLIWLSFITCRDAFVYKIFFFKACEIIKLEVRDKSLKRLNRLLK